MSSIASATAYDGRLLNAQIGADLERVMPSRSAERPFQNPAYKPGRLFNDGSISDLLERHPHRLACLGRCMGRFRNVDRRVPSSITLGSGEVEGFAFADTKGDSTESHVHVVVDEHP